MLNTMMGNENTSFANISNPSGIEILANLVFSFSITLFNMMKLLVILFIMKLMVQINIFIIPYDYIKIK